VTVVEECTVVMGMSLGVYWLERVARIVAVGGGAVRSTVLTQVTLGDGK